MRIYVSALTFFFSDMNLIKRIKSQTVVSMSTPYSENGETWSAVRAIDLIEDSRPYICHCCSSTYGDVLFWRLDLGTVYPIKGIVVVGRSDGKLSHVNRLWYFSSSVNSFFKRTCAAIQRG